MKLYCIPHEKEVDALFGELTGAPVHQVMTFDNTGWPDIDWCCGPFTYSPPPEEDTDEYYDWLFSQEDAIQDLLDYEVAQ